MICVGIGVKKDETIKIRVSAEQKRRFKDVATKKHISMSELLIGCTENVIEKERLKNLEYEITRARTEEFERKIQMMRAKQEERKHRQKQSIWKMKLIRKE